MEVTLTQLNEGRADPAQAKGDWTKRGLQCDVYYDIIRRTYYVQFYRHDNHTKETRGVGLRFPVTQREDWDKYDPRAELTERAWSIVLAHGGFEIVAEVKEPLQPFALLHFLR